MRALVFAFVALALLAIPTGAAAGPPLPSDLHVVGGDGWRAENRFDLRWTIFPGVLPIATVHYLVRNPAGAVVVGPLEIGAPVQTAAGIRVPGFAGAYTAEVWLEDSSGAEGAPADAKLRFDDQRPAGAEPIRPAGWIARTEFPLAIRIAHPAGVPPESGIRGYAATIDRSPAAAPCAGARLCSDAETDLRGGIGDDTVVVDELPEGLSFVHTVAVSGSQVHSEAVGHAPIRVDRTDPLTRLSGAPPGWTNRTVALSATATDSGSGMEAIAGGSPFTAIRIDGEAPIVGAGNSAATTVIAPGAHTVAFYARDAAGNTTDGADTNGRSNAPPRTVAVRIDREPPSVVFIGAADPGEPESISARVWDRLSGPDPVRGEIAVRPAGSVEPFQPLPTVAAGETLIGRWRSDEYPVGEYEFRATGFDAAGNSSSTGERANGAPMVLPNPLKSRATLVAGFGESFGLRPHDLTVRQGRGAIFSGRVGVTSDLPLGAPSVTVVERFAPGAAEPRRTTRILSGEDGRFRVWLEPGPSREVFAVFDGTRIATGTVTRPLRLGVRSGVRMRASAAMAEIGGRPVVFCGAVAFGGSELPPGGSTVQLQYRAAGLPWTELRTVQTNHLGRFRYAYRFSDDDSRGVRFQFRAFVPTQSDWPYEPGGSKPVAVRGA